MINTNYLNSYHRLVSVGKPNYFQEDTISIEFTSSKKIYINYKLDRVALLQSTNDAAEYLFTTLLYRAFNLITPECRIIEYSDPEFKEMLDALSYKTLNSELRNLIEYDFREKPFIVMYEYFPHLTFLELMQAKSKNQFTYRKGERSREIFINIGKTIAIDLIVNNPTRLPVVVNNIGSPHLICLKMLQSYLLPTDDYKSKNFLNIFLDDFPVVTNNMKSNTLDPHDKYQLKHLSDYRNTVADILKQMFYEFRTVTIYGLNIASFEFKSLARLKPFFTNVMGYDISSNNLYHVAMGIILLLDDFLRIDMMNILDLIDYVQKEAIYKDFGDTYYRSSFKLNIDYFKAMRDTLIMLRDEYSDIFDWSRENTFSVYSLNALNSIYNKSKTEDQKSNNNSNPIKNDNNTNNTNKPTLFSKKNVPGKSGVPDVGEPFFKKNNTESENKNDNTGKDSQLNVNNNESFKKNDTKFFGNKKEPENLNNENLEKTSNIRVGKIHSPEKKGNSKFPSTAELFYNNVLRVCDRYDELKYIPVVQELNNNNLINKNDSNKDTKNLIQEPFDHFNFNKNDNIKFSNDVHNGLYDVVDIDMEDKRFIMEWKDLNLHDGVDTHVPVLDIRSDEHSPEVKKKLIKNPELYDHKVYTRDELKELVMKRELKDTLNIKEELNPEEAEDLKSKVKNKDPELLEGKDYVGTKLGKKYEVNKKLDKDLEKRLKKIEESKMDESKLAELQKEKEKNEIKRKENEETGNLEHVDTIKTIKNSDKKGFFNKKN